MQESQKAKEQNLQSLHDREVDLLMKRLESQKKEEVLSLSKTHKDKNELSRIKRELEQKLIDQAVYGRQRLQTVLEKRKAELADSQSVVKLKLEEEKKTMVDTKNQEISKKCQRIKQHYSSDSTYFVQMYLLTGANGSSSSGNSTGNGGGGSNSSGLGGGSNKK